MEVCFCRRQVAQELTLWLVGTIECQADPSSNTWSNYPLGIISPTPMSIPGGTEREATNGMAFPEPQPPSRLEYSAQYFPGCTQEATADADDSVPESVPRSYDSCVTILPPAESQLSSLPPPAPSPRNIETEAVTQVATPNRGCLPVQKDTHTHLFVGNVRYPPSSSWVY